MRFNHFHQHLFQKDELQQQQQEQSNRNIVITISIKTFPIFKYSKRKQEVQVIRI